MPYVYHVGSVTCGLEKLIINAIEIVQMVALWRGNGEKLLRFQNDSGSE